MLEGVASKESPRLACTHCCEGLLRPSSGSICALTYVLTQWHSWVLEAGGLSIPKYIVTCKNSDRTRPETLAPGLQHAFPAPLRLHPASSTLTFSEASVTTRSFWSRAAQQQMGCRGTLLMSCNSTCTMALRTSAEHLTGSSHSLPRPG